MAAQDAKGRGRSADRPRDIPVRGWRDIAFRVKDELAADNIPVLAAGVAFYALLAIFPALGALVSIYGLMADPADVERQIQSVSGVLPAEARDIIQQQLHQVVTGANARLGMLGLGQVVETTLSLLRWPLLALAVMLFIAVLYRWPQPPAAALVSLAARAMSSTFSKPAFPCSQSMKIASIPMLPKYSTSPDEG